ncbi:MAG: TetR/AcrR family transcriptional regulator [Pseudomonadota bacterium]
MASAEQKQKTERYHHGDLRAALIAATRDLIEEKGIDGFSVTDACRRAGVSTAAPYNHFKNKDEMVVAATLQAMEQHHTDLIEDLEPFAKGSAERILAMGKNYIGFALREPEMFRLRFAQFDCEPHPDVRESGEKIYRVVKHEVADALSESEITPVVEERAFMLWSFVHGMSYLSMVPELVEKGPAASMDQILAEVGRRILSDPA